MKRICIDVSDETAATLARLVKACSDSNDARDGFTTHGKLTLESLLAMLVDDAAMVMTRPGSWEGSNMAQVLMSHGYDV